MKNNLCLALLALALAAGLARAADMAPLWLENGGGVSLAAGSLDAALPCQTMTVSLKWGGAAGAPRLIGKPAPCPKVSIYIGYLRDTLFIEGLDAKGGRLFVATGPNPLHQDVEAPSPSGMAHAGIDTPAPTISTLIRAPVTLSLARLRWYNVDAKYQPHLIGETSWVRP